MKINFEINHSELWKDNCLSTLTRNFNDMNVCVLERMRTMTCKCLFLVKTPVLSICPIPQAMSKVVCHYIFFCISAKQACFNPSHQSKISFALFTMILVRNLTGAVVHHRQCCHWWQCYMRCILQFIHSQSDEIWGFLFKSGNKQTKVQHTDQMKI